jgi:hypothetical protein
MQLKQLFSKIPLIIFCSLVSGCATVSLVTVPGPNGRNEPLIRCYALEDCFTKAAEVCAGHYQILNLAAQLNRNYLLISCETDSPKVLPLAAPKGPETEHP